MVDLMSRADQRDDVKAAFESATAMILSRRFEQLEDLVESIDYVTVQTSKNNYECEVEAKRLSVDELAICFLLSRKRASDKTSLVGTAKYYRVKRHGPWIEDSSVAF